MDETTEAPGRDLTHAELIEQRLLRIEEKLGLHQEADTEAADTAPAASVSEVGAAPAPEAAATPAEAPAAAETTGPQAVEGQADTPSEGTT